VKVGTFEAAALSLALALTAAAALQGLAAPAAADSAAPPPGPLEREHASLQAVCARCHNLQIVMDTPMSYGAWHETVQKMIDRGADATDDQLEDIMDYLYRTMTTIDVNSAGADELSTVMDAPDAVVKAVIARRKTRRFTGLDDLKTVPGIDAAKLDARSRLLFFQ
jgi:competence protein ComEA